MMYPMVIIRSAGRNHLTDYVDQGTVIPGYAIIVDVAICRMSANH